MAADAVDYERLEPIPASYGWAGILLSVAFFQTLNQTVMRLGSPKAVTRENFWKWRNLVVSWVHALVVGVWDLSCFVRYPELIVDLLAYHNSYIYAMVSFSTGYFVHDLIDIVVNGQSANMWEVIPHHLAVGGMFVVNLVECRYIAYSAVALLAEVNTIFLHARKLLQMAGVAFTGLLYRMNAFANILTFVGCRFLCLAWIFYGILFWHDRVSWLYLVGISVALFVMVVINAVLFWRLVSSDVLGRRRARQSSQKAAARPYQVLSDGSVPVSVEDVQLVCCRPTESTVSCLSGRPTTLAGLTTDELRARVTQATTTIPSTVF